MVAKEVAEGEGAMVVEVVEEVMIVAAAEEALLGMQSSKSGLAEREVVPA